MTSRSFALDQGAVAATASVQVENFLDFELKHKKILSLNHSHIN